MWLYQNKIINKIEDLPDYENLIGFVYKIISPTKKIYIGRKNFYTQRKKILSKKLQSTDKRKKNYITVKKESDWLIYNSSCEELIKDIKLLDINKFERQILKLCYTLKQVSYWELAYQMKLDVLLSDSYNSNINGTFFRKDLIN